MPAALYMECLQSISGACSSSCCKIQDGHTAALVELLCAARLSVSLPSALAEVCGIASGAETAAPAQMHLQPVRAVAHHVLICALHNGAAQRQTREACGALNVVPVLTGGAWPALDALALCAVLPGAECRHVVGELGGCGAAVPGGEGRSIGDAFGGYHRECGWRGVAVPVDAGAADVLTDVAVGALVRRSGRRGAVLLRGHMQVQHPSSEVGAPSRHARGCRQCPRVWSRHPWTPAGNVLHCCDTCVYHLQFTCIIHRVLRLLLWLVAQLSILGWTWRSYSEVSAVQFPELA